MNGQDKVGSRDQRNGQDCKQMQIRSKVGSRDKRGRPAVAGAHTPDSLERWKERSGRRRDKQPTISDRWTGDTMDAAVGWDRWNAAVAASWPMKVGTHDSRHEMPMKVAPRSWSLLD